MANEKKLGGDCLAYHNTGTYGSPTWNEITDVESVSRPFTKAAGEFKTRGNDWVLKKTGKLDAGITLNMMYDPGSDDWDALRDAFLNGTTIEIAVMDGAIASTGSQGLRVLCQVSEFPIEEPLEEGVTVNVGLVPTISDNDPEWLEVS